MLRIVRRFVRRAARVRAADTPPTDRATTEPEPTDRPTDRPTAQPGAERERLRAGVRTRDEALRRGAEPLRRNLPPQDGIYRTAASLLKASEPSTTSKVAYFKRKYAEEEDLHAGLRGYLQKHLILQEDRSCILKLSLQKLQFLEDPETYLRRSVLINNLLRKIHHEEEEEEEEEEGEEEEEDVEEEVQEVLEETLLYPDRKRLKLLVASACCPPPFSLDQLQRCRLVPCYPAPGCLYGLSGCPRLAAANHRLLLYNLDDHG